MILLVVHDGTTAAHPRTSRSGAPDHRLTGVPRQAVTLPRQSRDHATPGDTEAVSAYGPTPVHRQNRKPGVAVTARCDFDPTSGIR